MKKLSLSLLLASSMLHCSSAFAMNSDEDCLLAHPPAVFKAALSPSTKLFKHDGTRMGLIPVEPEEGIVLGEMYSISSSEEGASEPISEDTYQLLSNYYADAYVFFQKLPGFPGKRRATLTIRENIEHERSINLYLNVNSTLHLNVIAPRPTHKREEY